MARIAPLSYLPVRNGLFAALLLLSLPLHAAGLPEARTADEVLRSFRPESRIRIVNIWATWCVPCVAEISDVQAIADRYRAAGVEVIGISLDDAIPGDRAATKKKVEQFLASHHIHYRNVYFTGRAPDLADRLHFDAAIPITFVYDSAGRELARNEGSLDVERFRRTLEKLTRTGVH
jgi:thiol-disulfide isomerase/thioredoxin